MQNPELIEKLPSGIYQGFFDADYKLYFEKQNFNCDEIVDIPSREYEIVRDGIVNFLKPEKKFNFKKYNMIYKRSFLLHGPPGTGKTCLVNRISQEVVKNNGIVLFNPDTYVIKESFKELNRTQPDCLVLVVLEEFDELIAGRQESEYLNILDGEVQKNNVVFVATTNFIERIPKRICRPGRFSTIVEVSYPSKEARTVYLENKKAEKDLIQPIVEATDGFSIDEVKEVFVATHCLGSSLEDTVNMIKFSK